ALAAHLFHKAAHRSRIGAPLQIQLGANHPEADVIRFDLKRSIKRCGRLRILPETEVARENLLENKNISRIETCCLLQSAQSFFDFSLTAQNVAGELRDSWIVRQSPPRKGQFR